MDVSIISSSDVVSCSPKLFEKTCSAAAEDGCTSNTYLQLLTYGGAHLCSSSTLTYWYMVMQHPLYPGSKEALVLNLQAEH